MVSGGPRVEPPGRARRGRRRPGSESRRAAEPAGGGRVLAGCGQMLSDDDGRHRQPRHVATLRASARSARSGSAARASRRGTGTSRPRASRRSAPASPTPARGRSCGPATSGSCDGGQVFVTGRHKDLIILGGRTTTRRTSSTRSRAATRLCARAACAAFAIDQDDGEQLVVVQEVEAAHVRQLDADAVIGTIRQAVAEAARGRRRRRRPAAARLDPEDVERQDPAAGLRARRTSPGACQSSRPGPARGSSPAARRSPPSPSCRGRGTAQLVELTLPDAGEGGARRGTTCPGGPVQAQSIGCHATAPSSDRRIRLRPLADEIQRWLVAHLAEMLRLRPGPSTSASRSPATA